MSKKFASFVAAAAFIAAVPSAPLHANPEHSAAAAMRTQWVLRQSSGLDAIAFLGPLSGDPFYLKGYPSETAEFLPRLPGDFRHRIAQLGTESKAQDIMLTPILGLILSGAKDTSLDGLIEALANPEAQIRPAFAADQNWDEKQWRWFAAIAPTVRRSLEQMRAAGFEKWWHERFDPTVVTRGPEVERYLARYDLVAEQERLTGRKFDPRITIIFLKFVKPHGVKVQGQTFLTSFDYPNPIIVSSAAHEMLHPPLDMKGATAKRLIDVVGRDAVLMRAINEHDRSFGYTTVEGAVNEDLVQALEQVTCDRIDCGRSPAFRWNHADEGMHLIAAGVYGLLNEEGYPATGGNFEKWLIQGLDQGWLTGDAIRRSAARVLGRPVEKLWPALK